MKKIKISVSQLELSMVSLTKPMMMIGRSPVCDIVVRAKGMRPIHYILEWVGDGSFDPETGYWTIYDISKSEMSEDGKLSGAAEGLILSGEPMDINGFNFEIVEDNLAATTLDGGILNEQLSTISAGGGQVLEVAWINKRSGSVMDVRHYPPSQHHKVKLARNLEINYSGKLKQINWALPAHFNIWVRGHALDITQGNKYNIEAQDIIFLRTREKEFYIRVVPQPVLPEIAREIFSDPFFKLAAAVFLLSAILIFLLPKEIHEPEKKMLPPRIAKVEVKEVKVQPPPPPEIPPPPPPVVEPPKVEPPPPPPPVAKKPEPPPPAPKPVAKKPPPPPKPEVTKVIPPKTPAPKPVAAANAFKKNAAPPKPGLNSPAPVTDVNAVGFLGSLKKSGSNKPVAKVSADMVMNNGIVSETVSGSQGQVMMKQPPAGVVDLDAPPGTVTSGENLASASTTLSGEKFEVESSGPIARQGGLKKYTVGQGLGDESSKDIGTDGGNQEEITGGLTKEEVREAIKRYRKDIRTCYEKALFSNSSIKGRIVYKWYISGGGNVTSAHLVKSETNSAKLDNCVLDVIKTIKFPKAATGASTTVIYPFEFHKQ